MIPEKDVYDTEPFVSGDLWPGLLRGNLGWIWCGDVTYLHPRSQRMPHLNPPQDRGFWSLGVLSSAGTDKDGPWVICPGVRGVHEGTLIPWQDIRLDCQTPAVRDHLLRAAYRRLTGHYPADCPVLRLTEAGWQLDGRPIAMAPRDPSNPASRVYALVHAVAAFERP